MHNGRLKEVLMFEALRNMDKFTEDMFNRIIAFQEKEHPAWIVELPFSERIKDLPLHYLVFSNGDRDPKRHAHTVAPYFPLQWEMARLANYIRQLGERAVVYDLHSGNGFIGSLLAREGVQVIGLRDPAAKPNQIEDFCDAAVYRRQEGNIASLAASIDVAFSSWMPANRNDTPDILRHSPKLIIYIYTDHIDPGTGLRQTGTADAFDLSRPYELIDTWSITRRENLFREIWPDLTGNIEETRQVKVYAREDCRYLQKIAAPSPTPYDWENELDMILLAHQAKELIKARGFPV